MHQLKQLNKSSTRQGPHRRKAAAAVGVDPWIPIFSIANRTLNIPIGLASPFFYQHNRIPCWPSERRPLFLRPRGRHYPDAFGRTIVSSNRLTQVMSDGLHPSVGPSMYPGPGPGPLAQVTSNPAQATRPPQTPLLHATYPVQECCFDPVAQAQPAWPGQLIVQRHVQSRGKFMDLIV